MSEQQLPSRSSNDDLVFFFDVDNTLLDNDRVTADLKKHLAQTVGSEEQKRYWEIFETLRENLGYADYLGALQQYRVEHPHQPGLLSISLYLSNYPFANRLYPNSLDVIEHLKQFGTVVILTDGDVVFQPRKIERSGLYEAFEQRVLVYIHKEEELAALEKLYPAQRYVMIDDKLRILNSMKKIWGSRLKTVFPRQGHYAHDTKILKSYPLADINVERIGDLLTTTRADYLS